MDQSQIGLGMSSLASGTLGDRVGVAVAAPMQLDGDGAAWPKRNTGAFLMVALTKATGQGGESTRRLGGSYSHARRGKEPLEGWSRWHGVPRTTDMGVARCGRHGGNLGGQSGWVQRGAAR